MPQTYFHPDSNRTIIGIFRMVLRPIIILSQTVFPYLAKIRISENQILFSSQLTHLHPQRFSSSHIVRAHDLFPLMYPNFYSLKARFLFKIIAKRLNLKATYLCNSEYTKFTLEKMTRVPISQLIVVPCLTPSYAKQILTNSKCGNCICEGGAANVPERYVISIGSFLPRKNYKRLFEVWSSIRFLDSSLSLLIIGESLDKNSLPIFDEENQNNGIKLLSGYCNYGVYILETRSLGLISTSHDEGFNIPVHDALFLNKPVLVSDTRHHRELEANSLVHFLSNEPSQENVAVSEFLNSVNVFREEISHSSIIEQTKIATEEFKRKVFELEI